jgi:hypothetical protein
VAVLVAQVARLQRVVLVAAAVEKALLAVREPQAKETTEATLMLGRGPTQVRAAVAAKRLLGVMPCQAALVGQAVRALRATASERPPRITLAVVAVSPLLLVWAVLAAAARVASTPHLGRLPLQALRTRVVAVAAAAKAGAVRALWLSDTRWLPNG